MRIIHIITRSDTIGGANVHVIDLAKGQKNLGHEVIILIGGEGVVLEKAQKLGLSCISINSLVKELHPIVDILCFFKIRKHLKLLRPDIVHLHSSKAGILGRLAAYSLKLPNVFTAHGWAFTEGVNKKKAFFYQLVEKFCARFANKIITVSDYDRKYALDKNVSNENQMLTIHNGVNVSSNDLIEESDTPTIKIIMVARFSPPKQQKILINALSKLRELNWQLELVGDGELLSDCKELTASLGLSERIIFSGQCTDIYHRLEQSDIFVLISDFEGFPLTILEAMSCSLPVIASNVGGVPESVKHGRNGYLINNDDEKQLIDRLKYLIVNKEVRRDFGRNGKSLFLNNFTFEVMLDKIMHVYNEILTNNQSL